MTTSFTITTDTPPSNRSELAQAFGANQSAVRRLEMMTRDITINLPDAIISVYDIIQALQQAAYVLAAPNANLPNADVLQAGTGLTLSIGTGTITLALSIPVSVANGGTGLQTMAAHGVLVGAGTNAPNFAAPGTAGQVLMSNGLTLDPSFQPLPQMVNSIIAGTGINVSSPSGNVTVSLQTPVSIANGGTAGTTASSALANLGAVPQSTVGAANGVASLDVSGKVPLSQLPASVVGSLNYQGTWNASTNTPTLTSGVGTKGYFYKVSVAGSTTIDGISQWNVGDIIAFDGTTWDKIDGIPSEVTSVNGQVGAVTITAAGIGALVATNNLSDLANAATARTNLGLGTAAVQNVSYFLQAANNLSDLANAGTARTNLGLGSAATQNTGTSGATIPLLNGANTWSGNQSFTGTITPSQTNGIVGTTTNNNANAGSVGEYGSASASGVSLTSGTAANIVSMSLTAGDWDVSGTIAFQVGSGTAPTFLNSSISTTSATGGGLGARTSLNLPFTTSASPQDVATPTVRISISATTTVYLVGTGIFSGGTLSANGFIRARRVR